VTGQIEVEPQRIPTRGPRVLRTPATIRSPPIVVPEVVEDNGVDYEFEDDVVAEANII
jgi:hypothetical protein